MTTKELLAKVASGEISADAAAAQIAAAGRIPDGGQVGRSETSGYVWFRHPAVKGVSKAGKPYVVTVSMPAAAARFLSETPEGRDILVRMSGL